MAQNIEEHRLVILCCFSLHISASKNGVSDKMVTCYQKSSFYLPNCTREVSHHARPVLRNVTRKLEGQRRGVETETQVHRHTGTQAHRHTGTQGIPVRSDI
jgi:hypothetical protein